MCSRPQLPGVPGRDSGYCLFVTHPYGLGEPEPLDDVPLPPEEPGEPIHDQVAGVPTVFVPPVQVAQESRQQSLENEARATPDD